MACAQGGKVVIFALVLFAVAFCLRPLGKLSVNINPKLPVPPGPMIFRQLLQAFAVLIATGIMVMLIDRKPWGYFGMPLRNAFRSSFWVGAATGVGVLALQLEIMHLCGWFDYGTVQLNGGTSSRTACSGPSCFSASVSAKRVCCAVMCSASRPTA